MPSRKKASPGPKAITRSATKQNTLQNQIMQQLQQAVAAQVSLAAASNVVSYKTGEVTWTPDEETKLVQLLEKFSSDTHSSAGAYIKIAPMFKGKNIRDIAHRSYKLKRERAGGESKEAPPAKMMKTTHPVPSASPTPNTATPASASAAATAAATMSATPVLSGPAANEDIKFRAFLNDNVAIISSMRENLLTGLLHNNYVLMKRFESNVQKLKTSLASLPVEMPELQVKLNTSLILQMEQAAAAAAGGGAGAIAGAAAVAAPATTAASAPPSGPAATSS